MLVFDYFMFRSAKSTSLHGTGNLLGITGLSLEEAMENYKIPDLSASEIKKAAIFIRACLELRTSVEDLNMLNYRLFMIN